MKDKNKELEEKEKDNDEKEKEVEGIMGNIEKINEEKEKRPEENEKKHKGAKEKEIENREEEQEKAEENIEKNKEKPKSSDKDTKKLVILIISLLAFFAVAFFTSKYFYEHYSTPQNPQYTYNGFKFVKIAGLWHTQWQQDNRIYNVHLRYGPRESEDIPYYEEGLSFNNTGKIYITFDPTGSSLAYVALAGTEMSLSLSNTFNITPIAACYRNETEACSTRPIITCDNTDDAVIYIKEAQQPLITTKNNCLIIEGDKEDLVRAADKVLWIWYGIIK